ncbi:MAG: glutamate--cysteine ligase [Candidatus Dasytiphilus stammeri]
MISGLGRIIPWIKDNSDLFRNLKRGIERETLRVKSNGDIATTSHPYELGCPLTHQWITTDFAEALLEFITPTDININKLLIMLRDIHRYVSQVLNEERLWALSMPGFIKKADDIMIAQYGNSNLGRMKTLYREGLKKRYGTMMQIISGVHYNFSVPLKFWQAWYGVKNMDSGKEKISAGYLQLIRNYYRFGWIIPYMFGASPAICSSFLQGKKSIFSFEHHDSGMLYLPFATSLRLSTLGYTSKLQNNLDINLNNLNNYVHSLQTAINTSSKKYCRIGLKQNGHYLQLNTNQLQMENELYAPIRPKRLNYEGETLSEALTRRGIEYVEVRSLDINPFSPIGIDAEQIRFLDLFLWWCLLRDASEISQKELLLIRQNWEKIILYGRKPGQKIKIIQQNGGINTVLSISLVQAGKELFRDLKIIAEIMDTTEDSHEYQNTCDYLIRMVENSELTYSSRILKLMRDKGLIKIGIALSEKYHSLLTREKYEIFNQKVFDNEAILSCKRQNQMETSDNIDFDTFLAQKNSQHKNVKT